jgi:cyclophilin family peptidyl-prolyl cis-trans isomerase
MANPTVAFDTSHGAFRVELFQDRAPKTVSNFKSLVEKNFYDDQVFHRVIDGFMIQGGCPQGTGTGGPGYKIPCEFHAELRHEGEGILSMANAGPNTGGSQFFVTLAATPWLDDRHAVFGRVIDGMDVVRTIGKVPTGRSDRPVEEVKIHSVRVESPEAG